MSELNKSCILLAEDNPADVMLFKVALKEHAVSCKLLVMSDRGEALRVFQKLAADSTSPTPDLILLDLHLPKHDGLEIIQRVRSSQRCARTPVVVMSSSDSPEDRAAAQSHSALYFRKSSGLDEFLELGMFVKRTLAGQVRDGPL